jgi:lipoprotein-anchoring transpeptidase ErfK/SrfK
VLALTTVSAALQTPVSAPPRAQAPEFAKAALARITVHWVLVSIPDRKLALFENGQVVRIYRVAVGKTSTPSPAGEFKVVNRVTNQPNSIGKAASTGCIRMGKQDLEQLFAIVDVGDTVEIRAERDEQIAEVFGTGTGIGTGSESVSGTKTETIAQVATEKSSGNEQ